MEHLAIAIKRHGRGACNEFSRAPPSPAWSGHRWAVPWHHGPGHSALAQAAARLGFTETSGSLRGVMAGVPVMLRTFGVAPPRVMASLHYRSLHLGLTIDATGREEQTPDIELGDAAWDWGHQVVAR